METSTQPQSDLAGLLEKLAHLLPEQGPLQTFVHHNTLHALEHLPFAEAVVEASRRFGTEPFQTEAAFGKHLESGRILPTDIDAVLAVEPEGRSAGESILGGLTVRHFRANRLRHLFEVPRGAALGWHIAESEMLERRHPMVDASRRRMLTSQADRYHAALPVGQRVPRLLREAWESLVSSAREFAVVRAPRSVRRRDQLVALGARDVDQRVQPLLIRLTASFLDQGVAAWTMPEREMGLLVAVRNLYTGSVPRSEPLLRAMRLEFRRQLEAGESAEETIEAALDALGIKRDEHESYLGATLLALPGWAGMVRQFELRPDRAPVEALPARLMDFLALQLTLDGVAAGLELERFRGPGATWADLEQALDSLGTDDHGPSLELAYEAFVMAQVAPVDLAVFSRPEVVHRWLEETLACSELERRRLLHEAYERRLRVTFLDGFAAHCRRGAVVAPKPRFQALFCIDERECSTRRHLEEGHPEVETFGYAGFYGVAMAWQAIGEHRPRPLCPVNLTPEHFVTERALSSSESVAWDDLRRRRGLAVHALTEGSRSLAAGGLLTAAMGPLSVVPMIGRCLFPRLTERLSHRWVQGGAVPPKTRLVLEREGHERDSEGRYRGYSVPEMVDVVEQVLETIGLVRDLCELVVVVGHGSSSLNNPHEAAHDCGATGGGRGGPNARAFAAMANHSGVRVGLRERGLAIPDSTWFLGAYHNTCDDETVYYDLDLLPEAHLASAEEFRTALGEACQLEAHERCRRFESAPRNGDIAAAMRHVQGRSVDLGQPRPEYGHATNAYAVVGRRSRTRGLFMDRRAFLCSYDPTTDPSGAILGGLLAAVGPVGAGINLEYYFSFVDPVGYGCGTKLPHNITGLIGVMDGHASDLRTGLPWQMVEIHEPVRLLMVVEALPATLEGLLDPESPVGRLVVNRWVQLVAWDPDSERLWEYGGNGFTEYAEESLVLPEVDSSAEFYRNERGHLPCARITGAELGSESQTAQLEEAR